MIHCFHGVHNDILDAYVIKGNISNLIKSNVIKKGQIT